MSHMPRVVECECGTQYRTKRLEIGDWDMDTNETKDVAHGLSLEDIEIVFVILRNDADDKRYIVCGKDTVTLPAEIDYVDATNVRLRRQIAQFFDSTDFDSTGYNRGIVTILHQ